MAPLLRPKPRARAALPASPIMLAMACMALGYFVGVSRGGVKVTGAPRSSGKKASSAADDADAGSSRAAPHEDAAPKDTGTGRHVAPLHDDVVPAGGWVPVAKAGGGGGAVKKVCEDSCATARNGVCDEGRPKPGAAPAADEHTIFTVLCDLGTDCGDCGPWVHNNTDASDSWRPVRDIRAKNYTVLARTTQHPSRFIMAFTDPAQDVDVSAHLVHGALLEPGITWAWHRVLAGGCRPPGGGQGLVADVGGNFGYYTLLSVAMGCRVVTWEPVPYFAAYMQYGLLANNFTHAVQLRDTIVSNNSGAHLTIRVPNRGIWGTAGIDGANIDGAIKNDGAYDNITRVVERVDEVVKEDVLIMKVDVEGFEPSVLHGAKGLLLEHTVSHIFMEYSPGVAERAFNWGWYLSNPVMLMGLLRANYTILHIGQIAGQWPEWADGKQLPEMERVTVGGLTHDIWDAWRLGNRTMGCHNKTAEEEFAKIKGAYMFTCGAIPEGIDPRGFRATFGHNTNIWAFKGEKPSYVQVGKEAALAPLDFDINHEFFVPGGVYGAARRTCESTEPHSQVMHRCPCTDQKVCGELEAKVKELARQGLVAPFDMEPGLVKPEVMGIETWS